HRDFLEHLRATGALSRGAEKERQLVSSAVGAEAGVDTSVIRCLLTRDKTLQSPARFLMAPERMIDLAGLEEKLGILRVVATPRFVGGRGRFPVVLAHLRRRQQRVRLADDAVAPIGAVEA